MAAFNKNKLSGPFQSIAGPRSWAYTDTGLRLEDVSAVAGFFTTGYECGMRRGDQVIIYEGDTGAFVAGTAQVGTRRVLGGVVFSAVDTGQTQVTVGDLVVIGDTS